MIITPLGADLCLEEGDLKRDEGLVTAVALSLLSDALASPAEAHAIGVSDRRGWWGERLGDPYGSKLWLLTREKTTAETRARASEYGASALQWLIDDGIAESVNVDASFPSRGVMRLVVRVARSRNGRWSDLWNGTIQNLAEVYAMGDVQLRLEVS